ncbi:MAG: DUF565 domain-containing protein [Phormidesmis sp. RL_2_1]|nr:DUF565 domain-containing protein [Phormidesmis sp. RL_2_1]
MQRTRLNTLVNQMTLRFRQWVFNPWRRISVIVMSLLFGNFFAVAISATAGQTAKLDVAISAFLVIGAELISWLYYRFTPRRRQAQLTNQQAVILLEPDGLMPVGTGLETGLGTGMGPEMRPEMGPEMGPVRTRSTLTESLNAFKLGMIYGLFVEAFKLGS